jgi:holo-[acyl-carrier protein] synthase
MIYGIGTDICDVRRLRATFERRGQRFAEKILGPGELAVFHARSSKLAARGISYLATRFSAKEAFSKAIGLGLRSPMAWRDCEILNATSGQPQIHLHGPLKHWFEGQQLRAHVTLTDETDYAASFVVIETLPETLK